MSALGGRSIAQEIEEGRCVACGLLCDGYFCDACCFESSFVVARYIRDDERVGRIRSAATQRSWQEHRAAVHDQISSMQSSSVDRATASREFPSQQDRKDINAACDRVMGPAKFPTPYGYEFADKGLRNARRDVHQWQRFCDGWHRFAWAMLDDLTRPVSDVPGRMRAC